MEQGELKVLMISTDRKILEEGSAVRERMKEYGKLVTELHIVLLSDKAHKLVETTLDKNVWVYPTNSSSKWFRSSGAATLGKKIVLEKKFVRGQSVITTQDPFECGRAGLKVKNKWRIPLEVQLHTDPSSPYFSGFLNFIRKYIARDVIKHADTIRVVSEKVGEDIASSYKIDKKNIKVLPIYIDREKIETGAVKFDLHTRFGWGFVLLAVSRLSEEKNISMMLEVLKKILPFYPTTGLVVVGSGPEEVNLKKKAKDLGVDAHVAFVGWQDELYTYYHTSNAFIQTSYFEGYGLSLVEAGLAGLPIVSTPVGVANELESGVDAYICPQNDVEYMFKAVYDLIENNSKRESLSINIKNKIRSKLISKEDYLAKMKSAWAEAALKVNA